MGVPTPTPTPCLFPSPACTALVCEPRACEPVPLSALAARRERISGRDGLVFMAQPFWPCAPQQPSTKLGWPGKAASSRNSAPALDNFAGLKCHISVRRLRWAIALEQKKLNASDVRALYERHGPALLAYACSFVADAGMAEDLVQEVFVKLLGGETAVPDLPGAYLYRAVRNAALNARRNGQREAPLGAECAWFVHRGGDGEAALSLQSALAELPEAQREAVIMRIWSGMTLEEIAATTGVSLHTAASRYRYALGKLRQRLKPGGKV